MSGGITWGSNTVHTIGGTPAPAPSAFGAPSPAPASGGFGFGASSTPAPSPGGGLFGAPAPAPGGSLFGAPAPAPGGSLFGAPAPAPGGSLFGTPAPAPGGSLFGAPAPTPGGSLFGAPAPAPGGSLFGAPAPSAFGSTGGFGQSQQPQVPQHRIPAQAAMEAKISAERVVEAARIRTKIEKLHREYSGTCVVPEDGEESAKFVAIVYNDLTPEERQLRLIHGMATGQAQQQMYSHNLQLQQQQPIFAPPRPPQINNRDWKKAVVNNPDPNNYVPTPIIGAVALQGRVSNQQARAKQFADSAIQIQKSFEFIRQRQAIARQELMETDRKYATLRRRLLELMTRVEVARCLNKPLQADEHRVKQRLANLLNQVEQLRGAFVTLQDQAKTLSVSGNRGDALGNSGIADDSGQLLGGHKEELLGILTEQRRKLEKLNETAKTDIRDVGLIGRRVVAAVPASMPY